MSTLRARARELRKNPTDAERLLWQKLRYWQVEGFKFRRQQPVGPYIVDFVCLQKRMIIELDGGQHAQQSNYDKKRDDWLRSQNFFVLRFWNNDVNENINGVRKRSWSRPRTPPTSMLPRKGEGSRFEKLPNQEIENLISAESLQYESHIHPD